MLHRTSGVISLKAGCRRLQLPDDAALELVRFLQVKRVHDEFVPSTTKSCNMSPGAAMDKLWHFMLLNTDVSRCVHDLVGGVVRHVGTDEDDLDDNAKRMQRLYAMNIMAREGCQPDVRFWAVSARIRLLIVMSCCCDSTPIRNTGRDHTYIDSQKPR